MNKFLAFTLALFFGAFLTSSGMTVVQDAPVQPETQSGVSLVSAESILCEVGICGRGRNHTDSVRNIAFKCANGEWWWTKPGNEEPCKDAVKAKVPTTGTTWRIFPQSRNAAAKKVLQPKGSYIGISDGETVRLLSS